LREFHSTYYIPNNAVLVLAGDFKTSEAKRLIEKYYGPIPYRPLPRRDYPKERIQDAQRNAVVKKDVQGISFNVAFQGTENANPDMYPLDLAANILGAGTSSRLHKRLVYTKQSATSTYAYHSTMQGGGVFAVGVMLKPGVSMQESLDLVYQEIWKLRNKPVAEQELDKAKTQVMKEVVDGLTTIDGKARALAVNEILTGSYENLFKDLDKYNAVTPQQIKDVADKYLNQTQRSIIVLEAKGDVKPAPTTAQTTTKTETESEKKE
jgi:zinc protease